MRNISMYYTIYYAKRSSYGKLRIIFYRLRIEIF